MNSFPKSTPIDSSLPVSSADAAFAYALNLLNDPKTTPEEKARVREIARDIAKNAK